MVKDRTSSEKDLNVFFGGRGILRETCDRHGGRATGMGVGECRRFFLCFLGPVWPGPVMPVLVSNEKNGVRSREGCLAFVTSMQGPYIVHDHHLTRPE